MEAERGLTQPQPESWGCRGRTAKRQSSWLLSLPTLGHYLPPAPASLFLGHPSLNYALEAMKRSSLPEFLSSKGISLEKWEMRKE